MSHAAETLKARYSRLARVKRGTASPATPDERCRLADALIADCWQIAEAAQRSLPGAPSVPPWERARAADARAHRELQRRLRELLGRVEP